MIPSSSTFSRKRALRKAKPNWLEKWQVWWANLRSWRNEAPTVGSSKISDSNLVLLWRNPQEPLESKKCNYLRQNHHYGGQLQFGRGHRDMDSWVLRCLPGVKITYHLSPTRCRGLQRIVSTKVKPTQSTWRGEQIGFAATKMFPCHRNGEQVEESRHRAYNYLSYSSSTSTSINSYTDELGGRTMVSPFWQFLHGYICHTCEIFQRLKCIPQSLITNVLIVFAAAVHEEEWHFGAEG